MTRFFSIEILMTGNDTWVIALVIYGTECRAFCKDSKTAISVAKALLDIVFTEDKGEIAEKMKKWERVSGGAVKDEKGRKEN